MRFLRRLVTFASIAVFVLAGAIAIAVHVRPRLEPYQQYELPASPPPARGDLRVTFLGVSTLLFDDGETAFMTDGFFSRPPLLSMFTKIEPDAERIRQGLRRAGVRSLAAVIPLHSHYDHVLDAPAVAAQTGALLVGSPSTANVGRGFGLSDDRIRVMRPGEPLRFGRFTVTPLLSEHVPSRAPMHGQIAAPLAPPAKASDYRMAECYSLLIEHGGRTILVQGSAGFLPGMFRSRHADVAYLGIAMLGKQSPEYMESYWREVVEATGARRVVLIHWDDFFVPLDAPLRPLPRLIDDFDATMQFVLRRAGETNVEVRMPVLWAPTDPFARMR